MPVDFNAVKANWAKHWLTTILSLLLFMGVTYFLLFTESIAVKNNLVIEEMLSEAESIDVHKSEESALYEGIVVHIVGPLRTLEPITEPDYNIIVQAVKLTKRVQMYQWIEEETNQENFLSEPAEESHKTYWYHKDWSNYVIDSNLFYIRPGHQNPTSMPITNDVKIAENVKIGGLLLGVDAKRRVGDFTDIWSDSRPDRPDIKLHSGLYYHAESALEPEVGDVRVRFQFAGREDDVYTCVGLVVRGVIEPFSSMRFPDAAPRTVLRKGAHSLAALRGLEAPLASPHAWTYRGLSLGQIFGAIMTLNADWLNLFLQCQWVSNRLRRCTRFWVAMVLALSYTLFIISIPWLLHKPTFGVVLFASAMLPLLHYSNLLTRRS